MPKRWLVKSRRLVVLEATMYMGSSNWEKVLLCSREPMLGKCLVQVNELA